MAIILHFSSAGQCSNSLKTLSYDTLVTGIGYGNYKFSFPQLSADSGDLISVRINAVVSVNYGFTLRNADITPSTYTVIVGREDQFSSPLMTAPYDNIFQQKIGTFPLDPGGSVSRTPFAFMTKYVNSDSITSQVAPFIGHGTAVFNYSPITYTDIHANNNSSYYYSATARDTMLFSITYLYCKATSLASSLLTFTAALKDAGTVNLSWSTVNEQSGRKYLVQRSRDGQHFTTLALLPAARAPILGGSQGGDPGRLVGTSGQGNGEVGDYTYDDKLPTGSEGGWYYRLQIIDQGGSTYSIIKEVGVGEYSGRELSVYPNPAVNYVNLRMSPGPIAAGRWQVEICAADGSLVQRGNYQQSPTIRIDFQHKLPAGTYFVRATDQNGKNGLSASFMKITD